ncbi:MAG: TadE/TadG family protein [Hyphomicrobiaceae bacterium]|nr:TadE/TadG family protein [Hyphomicrobiaceae bacterium]
MLNFRTFKGDERGVTAIFFAVAFIVLVACIGAGTDSVRWFSARRITSDAVDAAVMAGMRQLQIKPDDKSDAVEAAVKFYQTNTIKRLPLLSDNITFAFNASGDAMHSSGTAYIATTFLNVVGITSLPVHSQNSAKATQPVGGYAGGNVEVSVMLDVTGSMCADNVGPCLSGAKMDGLKDAAKELVRLVVQDNQSTFTSRVALIPFSTRIRVAADGDGGAMMTALTGLDPSWSGYREECVTGSGSGGSEHGGDWVCSQAQVFQRNSLKISPCVSDRYFNDARGFDATDNPPGPDAWLNAHDGGRMPKGQDSSSTAHTCGHGDVDTDPATNWNYADGYCADVMGGNIVHPLSSNKSSLNSRIDALEGYGSTAGALGTAWAWYTLSPRWNGIFTGASAPGSYADLTTLDATTKAPRLRKIAVLMTDGGYNTYRTWKDQDQTVVSDYATSVCTNMKNAGIEVYTVAFGLDQLSAAEGSKARATLQGCGTDIKHFYETLTPSDLKSAFRNIGLSISKLRLVQ